MINLSCPGWNVNRIVMNIHDPCKHFRLIETMPIAKVAENWQPNSKNFKHNNEENSKKFLHVILEKIDATIIFCNTDIYDIMY